MSTRYGVAMFSGGLGSAFAAKRAAEIHGPENLTLLFADVKGDSTEEHVGEDADTYRFITEAAADVLGVDLPASRPGRLAGRDSWRAFAFAYVPGLVWVADGRTIWEVFTDERFLGNSRLASCSKLLKQVPARRWLDANRDPAETTVYVGIDWSESHRLPSIEKAYEPYSAAAPLTDPPYLDRDAMIAAIRAAGIEPPRLYAAGYTHNNCAGFCVRAGQAHFEHYLRDNPAGYAYAEAREEELRQYLGKPVGILNDRTLAARQAAAVDGVVPNRVPLTLRGFRERIEADAGGELFDPYDVGGCGCFVDEPAT